MNEIRAVAAECRVANAHAAVHKSECMYTFHGPYTTGILVSLQDFTGVCPQMAPPQNGIYVRIVQERVPKKQPDPNGVDESTNDTDAAARIPTKLGIGVEGGFAAESAKYDILSTYSVVVLREGSIAADLPYNEATRFDFPDLVIQSVDSIIHHVGYNTQQDVSVWQLDETIPVSKYATSLPFVDNGILINPNPETWTCAKIGATENLWLNLSDGYIGGGRQHWDGSGGSNGALDHFLETGSQYPLVVKLGTITADIETADCYSYAPDEDGPVRIPNLAELLEKRGINVKAMQKTVKSTAELEVELNVNYAFDAITEAGSELKPLSGPGLQGLQNLGNSCYMNSVLQVFAAIPEIASRYGTTAGGSITKHPLLQIDPTLAATDVLCQTTKVACALTSGVFARPLDTVVDDNSSSDDPKYRLAPRMFKHAIGKDHADFRTGQQQDAAQYLQYLLERWDRAELEAAATGRTLSKVEDAVHPSSHLFSFQTTERLVCQVDGKIKYKVGANESIWSVRIPMDKAVVQNGNKDEVTSPEQKRQKSDDDEKKPVTTIAFATCVEEWAKEKSVEGVLWPHLQNTYGGAVQQPRFANFPRYLIVQMQRYRLSADWTPIKLEVNLDIPEELDLEAYRSTGPQGGEELVPGDNEVAAAAPAAGAAAQPIVDENALSQLMDMGFSLNSSKRALNAVGGRDLEAAMNWVFEHNTDPDFNDPLPEQSAGEQSKGGGASSSGVDEGVVQTLVESLGCFTGDQVRAALKATDGEADRAADWLFSHMDDLDSAIAALQSNESSASGGAMAGPSSSLALDDGVGKYVMTGMISHIGKNTGSGHYVAHLKKDGQWVIFNDEKVALSAHPPFEHAYLYLFQRKDTMGSPHPNY